MHTKVRWDGGQGRTRGSAAATLPLSPTPPPFALNPARPGPPRPNLAPP